MKKLGWAFTLCVASVASAQETVKLLPTPLELSTRIGPLHFDGKPHQYEPAALGVSYQYNGPGLSLTVYIYDAGVANIPDGGDTVPSCHLFEQTKREIGAAGYSDVRLISEQLVRLSPPADAPLAREAVFEFTRNDQRMLSYVWLTSAAKHFVKIRFSMGENLRHEAEAARRFLLTALGDAVKPHLVPVDPDAKDSAVSLNLSAGSGSEDMAAALIYLTMLTTQADKTPELKPLCGGLLVPSFDTDLSAFQSLFAMNLAGTAGTLGKPLAAATEAGFLEEFVWMELHRDAWGNVAPEGLALPEYKAWRKKHLKRFKPPQLGFVVFNHPRPMKIEAPDAP